MSVFVSDILKLPALHGAKLLGGKSALSRIVSTVTVLEYANPDILHKVSHGNEYYRSEIDIGGFLNVPEDVELQVKCIRRMAEEGIVGLILYYVGIFMPKVDERLIQAADESDFALICMPENDITLRYSDAIYEIMELIFRDQDSQHSYVYDILDHVSSLSKEKQTIHTVLSMLSDELAASLILTDATRKILYQINWRDVKSDMVFSLEDNTIPVLDGIPIKYEENADYWMYRLSIKDRRKTGRELYILKKIRTLEEDQRSQAVELVRLAFSIWGNSYGEEVLEELVHAILKDDPVKMKRLAELFHVDTAAINTLWVIHGEKTDSISEAVVSELKNLIGVYTNIILDDYYENCYVIFSGGLKYKEEKELKEILLEKREKDHWQISVTYCGHMVNTTSVRNAYLLTQKNIKEVRYIFSHRVFYTLNEIEFMEECRFSIEKGEQSLEQILAPIQCLKDMKQKELLDTLSVYLLDAELSVQKTGELLYLHKNTVKYRIQRIAELTGIHIGEMPGTIVLYKAVVVRRFLDM